MRNQLESASLTYRQFPLLAVVVAFSSVTSVVSGCGKAESDSAVAPSPDGGLKVPSQLQGEWVGGSGRRPLTLTFDDLAINSASPCTEKFDVSKVSPAGPSAWRLNAELADTKWEFFVRLSPDGTSIDIALTGLDLCNGLSGTYKRTDSLALPETIQGTWYSCDVAACEKVRVLFTGRSVDVVGSGGAAGCISGTAKVTDIDIDGPLTRVKHSGLSNSGWEIGVVEVQGQGALELSGPSTLAGRYSREDCRATPRAAPAARSGTTGSEDNSGLGAAAGCPRKCAAEQNACVLRCTGRGAEETESCIAECAAKGQECLGDC